MILSVNDICKDLGCVKHTVLRWIRSGEIKAVKENHRTGWRIEAEDYDAFLKVHPRWRSVHDGDAYRRTELKVRDDALLRVLSKLICESAYVRKEDHNKDYIDGFKRATTIIRTTIDKELGRIGPA